MIRQIALLLVLSFASCAKTPKPNLAAPPKPQPVKAQTWTLNLSVPAVTFQYTDGRVMGNSGCNQYSGSLTKGTGEAITVGVLISTRRACLSEVAQQQETEYLARLQAAVAMRTDAGKLTIDYRNGNDIGSLEFTLNAQ